MELSKRLLAIVHMLKYENIIDVGTDHCYIPIHSIKTGIVKKAIAGDLNKGPLEKARENAENYNVADKIQLRLGSGLRIVQDFERQGWCAIIAGMGGVLINMILEADREKIGMFSQIILQPQSDVPEVRRKIHNLGLKITDETVVFDAGKYYNIISCENGEDKVYSEKDYILGSINIMKREYAFLQYIDYELNKNKKIIQGIEKNNSGSPENLKRIEEITNINNIYKEVLQTND